MIKPTFKLFAICILMGGLFTSCVSSKKYNELLAERDQLSSTLSQTQEMLQEVKDKNSELETDKNNLMGEIDQIKQDLKSTKDEIAEVKKMVSQKEAEISRIKGEIKSAFAFVDQEGMNIREEDDMFYISMDEKLLFSSGSAYVNSSGRKILDAMADMLTKNSDMNVLVEGHADSRPIATEKYPSNWELSTGRASAVVRHLVKKGIAPGRLIAAGRGDNAPAGEGAEMKMNRRVEIAIVPNVDKLYDMVKS